MYDVVIKRYKDVEEVIVYPNRIVDNRNSLDLAYDWKKYNPDTGEIYPLNVNTYLEDKRFVNPFEGDYDYFRYMHDKDEQNLRRSARRSMNKIKELAYCNEWKWFVTLTFNPEKVDSFDYDIVVDKLSLWLNNMRKRCKDMKYVVVPELHESGRWHFHGLFMDIDDMTFVDSGKRHKGSVIYNLGNYRLGFSTATEIKDYQRASTYISKYICKEIVQSTYNKKRYWYSRNCELPKIEKYMVDRSKVNVESELGEVLYQKEVYYDGRFIKYYRCPIYTTNTVRFNTSAEGEGFPL